jgi:hypothetical protein
MSEKDIRNLALFFFFALLDNRRAVDLTTQALVYCRQRKEKNPLISNNVLIVSATKKYWEKSQKAHLRGLPHLTADGGWVVPEKVEFGPWREFQKNSTLDELLIVIWVKILNISFSEVSEALGVTEGTLQYRMARALRKLGAMTNLFSKKIDQAIL